MVLANRARRFGLMAGWRAVVAVISVAFPELFEQVFYLEQDYKKPPTFSQVFCQKIENVFDLGRKLE
jgi:hypothetical protein